MLTYDIIYIVVTLNRKKNSYALRVTRPKSLAQNQFAYKIRIPFDRESWFNRIQEVEMAHVEKDTPQKVLDRMAGK